MSYHEPANYVESVNNITWNQRFYLKLDKEVHPFNEPDRFRPLDRAYDGKTTFWSTPSPEPDLNDAFWNDVEYAFKDKSKSDLTQNIGSRSKVLPASSSLKDSSGIGNAAQNLASSVLQLYPNPEKIIFVSILRAGVPITEWLCQMMPGALGAALSLFVGIGIDKVALAAVERDFPDRTIIFVDGWTGKGGVAREIEKLNKGPLAVLVDPWGWADFAGVREDIFCPSACFTGLATLGFSRTFVVDSNYIFSAYRFSEYFAKKTIVESWQQCTPLYNPQSATAIFNTKESPSKRFYADTNLRIHSNEVCRALINAAPEKILFADDKQFGEEHFPILLKLAEQRGVVSQFNVNYLKDIKTKVACRLSGKL